MFHRCWESFINLINLTANFLFTGLIICLFTLSGCQTEIEPELRIEDGTDSETDVTPGQWLELRQKEPGRFFAAIYYLPETGNVYPDRSRWAGQQPSSFAELMDPPEQEVRLDAFIATLSKFGPRQEKIITEQIERWIYTDMFISRLESGHSTEEVLAVYWGIEEFIPLFRTAFDSRNIDPDQWNPLDLVATLSSAEAVDIRLKIVTLLTLMDPNESLLLLNILLDKLLT
jgi:hypothetical protein